MPEHHPHKLEITEDARINLGIKGWWALLMLVFALGATSTGFQFSMNGKIQQLYVQNQHAHEKIMLRLAEMDARQQLFVLKQQLENTLIFIARRRDLREGVPPMTPEAELLLRQQIRDFMVEGSQKPLSNP